MPHSRCLPLALSALAFFAPRAFARPAAGGSVWTTLIDSAPLMWAVVLVAIIVVFALLGQLVFVLRRNRVAPAGMVEALGAAIHSGNYQEAWEISYRRSETALGRMLQPALERIGQGRDSVETRFAEESKRERHHLAGLLWLLLGLAATTVALCVTGAWLEVTTVDGAALAPQASRAAALAWGNAAMFVGVALAVAAPVVAAWSSLRARAESLLDDAGECGLQLVAGLPYEDIEGVRIGRDFHAGSMLADGKLEQTGLLQVSRELTTQCPTCNGPINSTRSSCPHCGQLLSWT